MKEILIVGTDNKFSTLPASGLQVGLSAGEIFIMSNSNYNTAILHWPVNENSIKKLNLLISLLYYQFISNPKKFTCLIYANKSEVLIDGISYTWNNDMWELSK